MAMKPRWSSKPEAIIGLDDCGGSKNTTEGAESWWIRWSSKLEAIIGLDDCGGSKNSLEGAESWWIERVSME